MATAKVEGTSTGETLVCDTLVSSGVVRGTYLRCQTLQNDDALSCLPLVSPGGYEWVVQHPQWSPLRQYTQGMSVLYNGQAYVVQAGQTSTIGVAPTPGAVWLNPVAPNPSAAVGGNNRIYSQNVVVQPDGSVSMGFCATDASTAVGSFNISATGVKTFNTDRLVLASGAGQSFIPNGGTTKQILDPNITGGSVVQLTQLGGAAFVPMWVTNQAGVGFTAVTAPAVGADTYFNWSVLKY